MARAGDVIVNPLTGERIRFHRTEAETAGESVLVECWVRPGGTVADAVGRDQHERVEVLHGTLGARLDAQPVVAGPGDRLTVMPGTRRRLWNAGEQELHVVCEVRPALGFAERLQAGLALAAAVVMNHNRRGTP